MTDWNANWAGLRALDDDDAWDRERERLDRLWKDEYRQAFVAYALSRRGWDRENAQVWAEDIVDDALIEYAGDPLKSDPVKAAEFDVLACEHESS